MRRMRCSTPATVEPSGVTATLAGIAQHRTCELYDGVRHRSRKEQGLPVDRQLRHDLTDIVDEAHIEHSIRFVEHEEFDFAEAQSIAPHKVEQPSRGRDEDVDPLSSARTWPPIGTPPITSAALMRRWRP